MKKLFVSFITTFLLAFMLTSCPGLMSDNTCSVNFRFDGAELKEGLKNTRLSREGAGDDCFMRISLEGDHTESQTVPFAEEMTVTFKRVRIGSRIRAVARIYVLEYGESGSYENVLFSGESEEIVVMAGENNLALCLGAPHTVTFNTDDGTRINPQTVEFGKKAVRPVDPTKEGFVFAGWYVDEEFRTVFEFNTVITEDTTLYAKWVTAYQVAIDSNITNGTITADKTTAMQGETVTLTVSPSDGYELSRISVNNDEGASINITAVTEGTTYTFTMPAGNVTVSATFEKNMLAMVDVARSTVTITGADPTFVSYEANDSYKGVFRTGRNVTLSPFKMSKYQITQGVYEQYMAGESIGGKDLDTNPSYCKESGTYPLVSGDVQSKRPVEGVTWYDAVYFCNVLTEKTLGADKMVYTISNFTVSDEGHITSATVTMDMTKTGYRIPTDAEWEFAARGGDASTADWKYMFSGHDRVAGGNIYDEQKNSGIDSVGWYLYNTKTGTTGTVSPSSGTQGYGSHEVGKKDSNTLGLYDMSGNVSEWCWDWYEGSIGTGNVIDPVGAGSGSYRVYRGGSWFSPAKDCSVCARGFNAPGVRHVASNNSYGIGFRVVRSISE